MFSYKICFLRVTNLQAMKILKYMTMTQRGSSLYEAKLARQIEELRENGVTIQIILDEDYLHVERHLYGFCVVLVRKRL